MVPNVLAGGLTALYSISASLIRIIGGRISDQWGGERTAITALTIMLIGAVIMSLSQNLMLSILATMLLAVGMGVANAAVFKLVPQEVPDAIGGAAGWVGGLGAFGGFVIPPLLGLFVSALGIAGYTYGFLVFVFLAITALGIAYFLRKS
jgi:MFS transporter, NNP family, nitrate/nitrite transporter